MMREHDEMEPRIKVGAAMHSRSFKEEKQGGGRSEIFGSVPRHHFCSNALAKWLVHEEVLVSLWWLDSATQKEVHNELQSVQENQGICVYIWATNSSCKCCAKRNPQAHT